jgi:hypothetical protein
MYLQYIYGVFECMHSIFECIWMYLWYVCGVFQCIYNIFQCIYSMFQCISMHFNVFGCIFYWHLNWNFTITFSCNVFAMHTSLHIFFSPYTMTPFPTCYTITFIFSIFVNPFQLSYNLSLLFTSIHHPTFHIPCRHWLRKA